MSTVTERLAFLNELNIQLDRPIVKTWKASKADLEATIAKRQAAALADQTARIEATVENATRIKITESAKNARLAKPTESFADVLREFNITPKVGRALLRRHKITTIKAAREFLTARK